MKILRRYLLRQHALPFLFALAALTSFELLRQIARKLGDLIGKGIPWTVILEFFLLTIPFLIAITLSMAVLVAVLYTMSRMTGDRELTAIRAGGVSLGQLVRRSWRPPPSWPSCRSCSAIRCCRERTTGCAR